MYLYLCTNTYYVFRCAVLPKYIIPKIMYIKKISPACLELRFPVVKCMSQMEYSVKTLATNDKIDVFLLVYCRYCEKHLNNYWS